MTHFGGPFAGIKDAVGKPFEDAGLGRVVYDVETSVSALTKLQAQRGNPPFNVVMFSRAFAIRAGKAGMLTPLTTGRGSEAAFTMTSHFMGYVRSGWSLWRRFYPSSLGACIF